MKLTLEQILDLEEKIIAKGLWSEFKGCLNYIHGLLDAGQITEKQCLYRNLKCRIDFAETY